MLLLNVLVVLDSLVVIWLLVLLLPPLLLLELSDPPPVSAEEADSENQEDEVDRYHVVDDVGHSIGIFGADDGGLFCDEGLLDIFLKVLLRHGI